jgi:predicted phosphoribosyltransferase
MLRTQCDLLVVLEAITHPHFAVGRFYVNFFEVSDDEVRLALERSRR